MHFSKAQLKICYLKVRINVRSVFSWHASHVYDTFLEHNLIFLHWRKHTDWITVLTQGLKHEHLNRSLIECFPRLSMDYFFGSFPIRQKQNIENPYTFQTVAFKLIENLDIFFAKLFMTDALYHSWKHFVKKLGRWLIWFWPLSVTSSHVEIR